METPYERELRLQSERMAKIQAKLIRQILAELTRARDEVTRALKTAKPGSLLQLTKQKSEIEAAIVRFEVTAASIGTGALGDAWVAGMDLVQRPASVLGFELGPVLRVNDRALLSLRTFMTDRIKDISAQAIAKINTQLAQVLIGVKPLSQAITDIQDIMGGVTRRRAMSLAYTEVGRAYSAASYSSMQSARAAGVRLGKGWIESGKVHPRKSHSAADGQVQRVEDPFVIVDLRTGVEAELRYPRDELAPIGEVINCGCIMVPLVHGARFNGGYVVIDDDGAVRIEKTKPAQEDLQALVDRVNDRTSRFLNSPGIKITDSSNAVGLLEQMKNRSGENDP